ncbi:MAG: Gfo/Idh/MocA family oxidoreductase, partial [Rhodospirillaceae bacterium]|nr:Gfo/Idh/MocA family oxidoreductase [Rhodospirillaceae bacterium]
MLAAGIVGVGWWGQNLVNASGAAKNIEIIAGAVRNPDKVAEYADEKGMTLHTGLEAMLNEADLDAVVLATPHSLHVEQMLLAIEAGKHVLSEKPFTMSKADAERVLDAADAALLEANAAALSASELNTLFGSEDDVGTTMQEEEEVAKTPE